MRRSRDASPLPSRTRRRVISRRAKKKKGQWAMAHCCWSRGPSAGFPAAAAGRIPSYAAGAVDHAGHVATGQGAVGGMPPAETLGAPNLQHSVEAARAPRRQVWAVYRA